MTIEAIGWMCASSFLVGYAVGETVRLVQEIRNYRRAKARLA
jgi:hypothetical protein